MNLQILPEADRPTYTAGLSSYVVTTVARFDATVATRNDLFAAARTVAEEVWDSPSGLYLTTVYAERRDAITADGPRRALMDLAVHFGMDADATLHWITFWEDGAVDCK